MIYIGADHRGYSFKEILKVWLIEQGYEVEDVGNFLLDPDDDYVDPAVRVGEMIQGNGQTDRGILLCGSGHGVDMVANRFSQVRAIIGYNDEVTAQGRQHEDANVLVLPSDWMSEEEMIERAQLFLQTEKDPHSRHERRRARISELRIVI
jgi:ribose 5-phosphate isomerase B